MKITKYEHSCVVIEEKGEKVVIDPGELTVLPTLTHVRAIIFTHVHGDHFSLDTTSTLRRDNPGAVIFASPEVAEKLVVESIPVTSVTSDQAKEIGPFTLRLRCVDHAVVHQTSPCKNLTVSINDIVYHPGDSFVPPVQPVSVCLVPLAAPWQKVSEAMDFINVCSAQQYVPIHDAVLSEAGKGFYNNWAGTAANAKNASYVILKTGETLDV